VIHQAKCGAVMD